MTNPFQSPRCWVPPPISTADILRQSIAAAAPGMITVSLRRQTAGSETSGQGFWQLLQETGILVLPNTAGCQSVQEAVTTAQMAREVFETGLIKLELIGDDDTFAAGCVSIGRSRADFVRRRL